MNDKVLTINIWKTHHYFAYEIQCQFGLPKKKTEGYIRITDRPKVDGNKLYLRGSQSDYDDSIVVSKRYEHPVSVDMSIKFFVNRISEELFQPNGVSVGDLVFADDCFTPTKLLAILPETDDYRYIVESGPRSHCSAKKVVLAKPLKTIPHSFLSNGITTYTWSE